MLDTPSEAVLQSRDVDKAKRIDIALKEYDWLHAEIQEQIKFRATVSLTVVIAIAATVLRLDKDFRIDCVLMFLPIAGLTLEDLKVHRLLIAIEIGRRIAVLENRLFLLAEVPLLTIETELVRDRQDRRPQVRMLLSVAVVLTYTILELLLFWSLHPGYREWVFSFHPVHKLLLIGVFAAPPVCNLWFNYELWSLQATPLDSELMQHLREEAAAESSRFGDISSAKRNPGGL